MSHTDGQTDGWTDEQDWSYRTLSKKMEVWSCVSEIRQQNFLKLFGLIMSNKERINTRKGNTINIVQRSKSSKQWSLANLLKITFILFECHRSIANSIISLCYSEKVHDNKEFNLKIHNLNVNPKSRPVKSNSEQHQFSFKYVSSKNQW